MNGGARGKTMERTRCGDDPAGRRSARWRGWARNGRRKRSATTLPATQPPAGPSSRAVQGPCPTSACRADCMERAVELPIPGQQALGEATLRHRRGDFDLHGSCAAARELAEVAHVAAVVDDQVVADRRAVPIDPGRGHRRVTAGEDDATNRIFLRGALIHASARGAAYWIATGVTMARGGPHLRERLGEGQQMALAADPVIFVIEDTEAAEARRVERLVQRAKEQSREQRAVKGPSGRVAWSGGSHAPDRGLAAQR
jgi:hypothetical protein